MMSRAGPASRLRWLALVAAVVGMVVASTRVETAVRPPRLEYQLHTLDNGLTVILSEDHSTPIVHLQLVYRVGSKNERRGRPGSRISSST